MARTRFKLPEFSLDDALRRTSIGGLEAALAEQLDDVAQQIAKGSETQPELNRPGVVPVVTVSEPLTARKQVSVGLPITDSVSPTPGGLPAVVFTPAGKKIRRARRAEDGHSLGEDAIYRALWDAAAPESSSARQLSIGYDRLAALSGLHWTNVRKNLQALEKKLAVEVLEREDSASRTGKRYRIYSRQAILERREEAGMVWVRRTKGVEFVQIDQRIAYP